MNRVELIQRPKDSDELIHSTANLDKLFLQRIEEENKWCVATIREHLTRWDMFLFTITGLLNKYLGIPNLLGKKVIRITDNENSRFGVKIYKETYWYDDKLLRLQSIANYKPE